MSQSKHKIRRVAPPDYAVASLPEPPIEYDIIPPPPVIPAHWQKGQLLNVRAGGEHYVITLYPDEDDWRYPERSIRFTNSGHCQQFVSEWYARENHDPRA